MTDGRKKNDRIDLLGHVIGRSCLWAVSRLVATGVAGGSAQTERKRLCLEGRGEISQASRRAVYFFLLPAACRINQHLASSQRHKENLTSTPRAPRHSPHHQPAQYPPGNTHQDQQHPPAPALPVPHVQASAPTAYLCSFVSPAPGRATITTKISGLLKSLFQEFSYPFQ